MTASHATVNGLSLAYRLAGPPGAPVVMLANSLGTTQDLWRDQVPALLQRYRVLTYDLRGHGESAVPTGESGMADLAADAAGLIRALDLPAVHFVGLSLGGMVGQALALDYPDRVASLVLAGTTCAMGDPQPWNDRIAQVRTDGTRALAERVLANWFTPGFAAAAPATVDRIRQQILSVPAAGYASCCAAVRDLALCERLGEVDKPTLALAGSDDPVTPPDIVGGVAERIPGADLRILAEVRHLMNVERPGAFNEALIGFLDRQPR